MFELFSGIGGIGLGLKQAGHKCVGWAEWDKNVRRIYEHNFPGLPNWTDVTEIKSDDIPECDILTGGFPCQPFSIQGKQLGLADVRGTLFAECARIAKDRQPKYFIFENVMGLLQHDNGRTIQTILRVMENAGYDIRIETMKTVNYIPQTRERIFIIGVRSDLNENKEFGSHRQLSKIKPDTRMIRDILQPDNEVDDKYYRGWDFVKHNYRVDRHGRITRREFSILPSGIHILKGTFWASHAALGCDGKCRTITKTDADRMFLTLVSPHTLLGYADTATQTILQDTPLEVIQSDKGYPMRVLTPIEIARLSGFPDDWTKYYEDGSDVPEHVQYAAYGNCVTPPVVKHLAELLV